MATNTILQLLRRPTHDLYVIPVNSLRATIEQGDRDKLFDQLKGISTLPPATHDKTWLELIAEWQPKEGGSALLTARWAGLRLRIDRLDDTREGPFTLTPAQETLIWNRIKDPAFAPFGKLTPQWSAFLTDYLAATGRHFDDLRDDEYRELMADPDQEAARA